MEDIKMVEWFNDHWYKIELGENEFKYIPSVTTKLGVVSKPFLAKWRGDIGNREADMRMFEAAERGSRIHRGYEIYCKGGLIIYNPVTRPNYTPEEMSKLLSENPINYICQYQDEMWDLLKLSKFIELVKPKIIASEMTVCSLKDNDAGTMDSLFEIKEGNYPVNGSKPLFIPGGVYVADLKTGNVIDKNAYRQTAAYVNCVREMKISNPVGSLILHTGSKNKNGIEGFGVHVRIGDDLKNDYKSYRLAASLWEEEHGDDSPRIFEFPSQIKKEVLI